MAFKYGPASVSEELQKRKEAAIQRLGEIKKAARACFANDSFKRYKALYEHEEQSVINALLNLSCSDPVAYAFEVNSLISTLRVLRKLIVDVERDGGDK